MPAVKNRLPAIITSDGFLDPETLGDVTLPVPNEPPQLLGHMVITFRNDSEAAIARDLESQGHLEVVGKSGHSRVLATLDRIGDQEINFDRQRRAIVPIGIASLRAVEMQRNGIRDEFLSILSDMVRERRHEVGIGRLVLAHPADALTKGDIVEAIKRHRLLLPSHVDLEQDIQENGTIELALEDLHYLFCEENFDEEAQRRVIRFGKHGLSGLVAVAPDGSLPPRIRGRQGLVGAIKISIGPYVAIIDRDTNTKGVVHLAARVLDGVRTTGIDVPRQVELFNKNFENVSTEDLKVRLRLYHATKDTQDISDEVINEQTIAHGVSFPEIIELAEHPERLMRLMKQLGPTSKDYGPYGYLVGSRKAREIPWLEHPSFQQAHLRNINANFFVAGDARHCVMGENVPHFARPISSRVRFVGREQNEGRICASWGFPDPDVMEHMLYRGTGVFVAHDLGERGDAFSTAVPMLTEDRMLRSPLNGRNDPVNSVYFDGTRFAKFQSLYDQGARFYMVRHPYRDPFDPDQTLPEEVLEWDKRGFWVRPSEKERLDKIDTLIAMYGSHTEGMKEVLTKQLTQFSFRLKEHFGSCLAYIHGKGPGVMYIADDIARNLAELAKDDPEFADKIDEGIFSIGVGIDAEQLGQLPNFRPPAQVDFQAKDRLIRQKHMNDRATINVFNIGGAGTLEEIAITLCSQKLRKNIPAPLIFVDPKGLAQDKGHLWKKLQSLVEDLAASKAIESEEETETGMVKVQLLQSYMANFIHIVDSYDAAAALIIAFEQDPVAYYRDTAKISRSDLEATYEEALRGFLETKFPIPKWLRMDRVLDDTRWNE